MQRTLQRLRVRPSTGLAYEHMFPRLRQQILARVDLVVELSTLGEYGIDERGGLMALEPCAERFGPARPARTRDLCGEAAQALRCTGAATDPGRGLSARP